jgi:hypothetical protein
LGSSGARSTTVDDMTLGAAMGVTGAAVAVAMGVTGIPESRRCVCVCHRCEGVTGAAEAEP